MILDQIIICSFLGDEGCVISCFNNFALIEHNYLVGVFDSRKSMGDNDDRASFVEFI